MTIESRLDYSFTGLIVEARLVTDFKVKMIDARHTGLGRCVIHQEARDGAEHFDIVKLTAKKSGRSILLAVLDFNEDASKEKDVISLDKSTREFLDIELSEGNNGKKCALATIEVRRMGRLAKWWWYLSAKDPTLHLPAQLAVLSLALGLMGLVLGIISICR